MPASYTHFAIAKAVLARLPESLKDSAMHYPELYFFGAQGADFCFFYRALRPSEINFGRFLHNRGSYSFFLTLSACAKREPRLFAYALGYITHYAADCVFHPYVYHTSGKSPVKHTKLEGALDYYFSKQPKTDNLGKYFNAQISDRDATALYALFALAAAREDRDPIIKTAFLNCIKNYRAYVKVSACVFAKDRIELLNAEHKEWRYPDDENKILNDGADEMFSRAVEESLALTAAFSECTNSGTPPPRPLFGKNFLSGL